MGRAPSWNNKSFSIMSTFIGNHGEQLYMQQMTDLLSHLFESYKSKFPDYVYDPNNYTDEQNHRMYLLFTYERGPAFTEIQWFLKRNRRRRY